MSVDPERVAARFLDSRFLPTRSLERTTRIVETKRVLTQIKDITNNRRCTAAEWIDLGSVNDTLGSALARTLTIGLKRGIFWQEQPLKYIPGERDYDIELSMGGNRWWLRASGPATIDKAENPATHFSLSFLFTPEQVNQSPTS